MSYDSTRQTMGDDLTVDQVRVELATLIVNYPNYTGKTKVDHYNDGNLDESCVYYKDEDGNPIDVDTYGETNLEPEFVTPVCIIGHWIEDFHPELKDDPLMRSIITKNQSLRGVGASGVLFDREVWSLLSEAQRRQDRPGTRWSDIDISIL